eukprot:scpid71813/ scgid6556/ 
MEYYHGLLQHKNNSDQQFTDHLVQAMKSKLDICMCQEIHDITGTALTGSILKKIKNQFLQILLMSKLMPFFARMTIASLNSGSGRLGSTVNWNRINTPDSVRRNSFIAKTCPMQLRGPAENGIKARGCLSLTFSSEKRSGSNTYGSG